MMPQPADLPVQAATKYELVRNEKALEILRGGNGVLIAR